MTCIVCGTTINCECYVARVDDGRPPNTPHRWRKVGHVCDNGRCNVAFDNSPYDYAPANPRKHHGGDRGSNQKAQGVPGVERQKQ